MTLWATLCYLVFVIACIGTHQHQQHVRHAPTPPQPAQELRRQDLALLLQLGSNCMVFLYASLYHVVG